VTDDKRQAAEQGLVARFGENWLDEMLTSHSPGHAEPVSVEPVMDDWDRMLTLVPTLTAFGILVGSGQSLSVTSIVEFLSSLSEDAKQALGDTSNVNATADVVLSYFSDETRAVIVSSLSAVVESMLSMSLNLACAQGYRFRLNELSDPELVPPGQAD
jgi:hypothetical protein